MLRKLTRRQALRIILEIPERDGLMHDYDVRPDSLSVVWWMPGDRSRVVRVECTRTRTRVACADCHGGNLEFTVSRSLEMGLIPLVRTGIDWLTGDMARRQTATPARTAPEAPGRTDAATEGREVDCGGGDAGGAS